jgi:hypothetical protein
MKNILNTLCIALLLVTLSAGDAQSYPIPDMEGAKLVLEETQLIADTEPRTEITIRSYTKTDGTRFREYSVSGNVFRYDIDEDGIMPYEYRVLDSDGDGTFETKEMLVGMSEDDGQKYFIDLGSEPGKEYRYRYEDTERLKEREHSDHQVQRRILRGNSIFIPAWVVVEFE